MYLDFLLIIIAAACNALIDTVDHHFSTSIFDYIKKPKWRLWFNSDQGWKNKYIDRDPKRGLVQWSIFGYKFNKPVQLSDSWHFFKMFMIFIICLIPAMHVLPSTIYYFNIAPIFNILIHWAVLGTLWNVSFSSFYNRFFMKKK